MVLARIQVADICSAKPRATKWASLRQTVATTAPWSAVHPSASLFLFGRCLAVRYDKSAHKKPRSRITRNPQAAS